MKHCNDATLKYSETQHAFAEPHNPGPGPGMHSKPVTDITAVEEDRNFCKVQIKEYGQLSFISQTPQGMKGRDSDRRKLWLRGVC